jgi:putative restriction endonuclease
MREVAPGDLILSFQDTHIRSVGIARSYCYEFPKPAEFGGTGTNWGHIGWKVDVGYRPLSNQIRPQDHMDALAPVLPEKYSPIQVTGRGNQGVYLAEIPPLMMTALTRLIGEDLALLVREAPYAGLHGEAEDEPVREIQEWESRLSNELLNDTTMEETTKRAIVMARRGQGLFREQVYQVEHSCRITKVDRLEHLRASHIKPWRDSNNIERLDGQNGLLLTPSIDHLFDRGFISFEDNGHLLISPIAHRPSLERMGVPTNKFLDAGPFTDDQKKYLDFHREFIFLESRHSNPER